MIPGSGYPALALVANGPDATIVRSFGQFSPHLMGALNHHPAGANAVGSMLARQLLIDARSDLPPEMQRRLLAFYDPCAADSPDATGSLAPGSLLGQGLPAAQTRPGAGRPARRPSRGGGSADTFEPDARPRPSASEPGSPAKGGGRTTSVCIVS